MNAIPKADATRDSRIKSPKFQQNKNMEKVVFSFEAIERNEYFNLDGTCSNWASDLFNTMQQVSKINIKEIYAGHYTGRNTPLRIHQHGAAKAPCHLPEDISLNDMWQIRISRSKGGIHGVFSDNIFYVIWFDPHHNLYPDKNHGGLKKVKPPSTCCKDRDEEIAQLKNEIEVKESESKFWEEAYEQAAKKCQGCKFSGCEQQ